MKNVDQSFNVEIISPLKKQSDICVVIITFARVDYVIDIVNRLQNQTYKPDILVTDNSPDSKIAMELKKKFPNIGIIEIKGGNVGPAGTFFVGEKFAYDAGYKYIIIADDDAFPESKKLIEVAVKTLEKDTAASVVISSQINNTKTYDIAQLSVIRREVFEKIGFTFAPIFRVGEDVDFTRRVRLAGFKIVHSPELYRHPPMFISGLSPRQTYYLIRNHCFGSCSNINKITSPTVIFPLLLIGYFWVHLLEKRSGFRRAIQLALSDFIHLNFGPVCAEANVSQSHCLNRTISGEQLAEAPANTNNYTLIARSDTIINMMKPDSRKRITDVCNLDISGAYEAKKRKYLKTLKLFRYSGRNVILNEHIPPPLLYLFRSVSIYDFNKDRFMSLTKERGTFSRTLCLIITLFGSIALLSLMLPMMFIWHILFLPYDFFERKSKELKIIYEK